MLENLIEAISGPGTSRTKGPWIYVLVIVLGVLVGVAAALLALVRRNMVAIDDEAARAAEKLIRAKEDVRLAENEQKRAAATEEITKLTEQVELLKAKSASYDARRAELQDQLTKVNSWDNLVVRAPR